MAYVARNTELLHQLGDQYQDMKNSLQSYIEHLLPNRKLLLSQELANSKIEVEIKNVQQEKEGMRINASIQYYGPAMGRFPETTGVITFSRLCNNEVDNIKISMKDYLGEQCEIINISLNNLNNDRKSVLRAYQIIYTKSPEANECTNFLYHLPDGYEGLKNGEYLSLRSEEQAISNEECAELIRNYLNQQSQDIEPEIVEPIKLIYDKAQDMYIYDENAPKKNK